MLFARIHAVSRRAAPCAALKQFQSEMALTHLIPATRRKKHGKPPARNGLVTHCAYGYNILFERCPGRCLRSRLTLKLICSEKNFVLPAQKTLFVKDIRPRGMRPEQKNASVLAAEEIFSATAPGKQSLSEYPCISACDYSPAGPATGCRFFPPPCPVRTSGPPTV